MYSSIAPEAAASFLRVDPWRERERDGERREKREESASERFEKRNK
jgi:hypothetical protein